VADAKNLRTAMKGTGTDEKMMINILCHRSRDQLQQIAAAFQQHHGKNLRAEIKSEVSGNLKKLLIKRFDQPTVLKAKGLKIAMKGAGTNEGRLIDCIAFTPNAEMPVIKQLFHQMTGKDLMHRISSETSGDFKNCLIDLCGGDRDESQVNPQAIAADVHKLYKAGEGKVGTDEKVFIKTLANHAPWYNSALNQAYGQTHKHTLVKAIEKEFSMNIKNLLVALCLSPYEYWADRLFYSMKGVGTDDKTLCFVLSLLERHEIQFVAGIMKTRHGKDLDSMIKGDLSGDYERAARAICGFK